MLQEPNQVRARSDGTVAGTAAPKVHGNTDATRILREIGPMIEAAEVELLDLELSC